MAVGGGMEGRLERFILFSFLPLFLPLFSHSLPFFHLSILDLSIKIHIESVIVGTEEAEMNGTWSLSLSGKSR